MGTLLKIPLALPLTEEGDSPRASLPAGQAPAGQAPDGRAESTPRRWELEALAGGISELSSATPAAGLTAAARLLGDAQERGEPAAWIATGDSLFYPPDFQDTGIDLAALPVVCVTGAIAGARAAEHLLRSGAFGLVVLDFGSSASKTCLPAAVQVRLGALCRRHRAALLLLARTPEGAPPAASLASLRARGTTARTAFDRFTVRLEVSKDKRRGAGWNHEEVYRGPDGLC